MTEDDEESLPNGNHPVSAEPSTTAAESSNPTPPRSEPHPLSEDPESVKSYLANAPLSENRKTKVLEDVSRFYAYLKIPFDRPRYKRIETLPFIPLEGEIDRLIAGVGQKSAAFLQCIKETAARPGKAWSIKWTDIDSERSCITTKPEKNSNPRQRKVSPQLMTMLDALPHRWVYIFHRPQADSIESLDDFRRVFSDQQRKAALSLQNPRIRVWISWRVRRGLNRPSSSFD